MSVYRDGVVVLQGGNKSADCLTNVLAGSVCQLDTGWSHLGRENLTRENASLGIRRWAGPVGHFLDW